MLTEERDTNLSSESANLHHRSSNCNAVGTSDSAVEEENKGCGNGLSKTPGTRCTTLEQTYEIQEENTAEKHSTKKDQPSSTIYFRLSHSHSVSSPVCLQPEAKTRTWQTTPRVKVKAAQAANGAPAVSDLTTPSETSSRQLTQEAWQMQPLLSRAASSTSSTDAVNSMPTLGFDQGMAAKKSAGLLVLHQQHSQQKGIQQPQFAQEADNPMGAERQGKAESEMRESPFRQKRKNSEPPSPAESIRADKEDRHETVPTKDIESEGGDNSSPIDQQEEPQNEVGALETAVGERREKTRRLESYEMSGTDGGDKEEHGYEIQLEKAGEVDKNKEKKKTAKDESERIDEEKQAAGASCIDCFSAEFRLWEHHAK